MGNNVKMAFPRGLNVTLVGYRYLSAHSKSLDVMRYYGTFRLSDNEPFNVLAMNCADNSSVGTRSNPD